MQTVTIKITDDKVFKLIEYLETLGLIQIDKSRTLLPKPTLSQQLAGSISVKQAVKMETELKQMRTEWNRNI